MHKHVFLCAVMALLGLCAKAVAEDKVMPQFGHETVTVSAGSPVTFRLDLSSLGAVTRLEFEMFTTKSDSYGFTTPTYFCLDNFGATAPSPATGVGANVLEQQAVKRIENGVLYITLHNGARYDARGERVE